MNFIPCLLCSKKIEKKTDKNTKPYFICDPCGMQMFVRRKQGIENLEQLMKILERRDFRFRQHSDALCELQALLAEMRGVKEEIKSIEDKFTLFNSKRDRRDKERTLKLLNTRIDYLFEQLKQLADGHEGRSRASIKNKTRLPSTGGSRRL